MSGLTIETPATLDGALASANIIPGDTLLLRGGTYSGNYTSNLDGTALNNITVRPYQTEKPIINGYFGVIGSYIVFRDLEICYQGWTTRETADPLAADIPAATLNARAPNCKFINCIIHDMRSPYIGREAVNAEFYGCVLYHNGWLGTVRGHGHALYIQNQNLSSQMVIKDCIMFDCFGWGLHAYAGTGDKEYNVVFEGNTAFRSGSLAGTPRSDFLLGADVGQVDTSRIVNNMSYGGSIGLQFYGGGAINVTLENNYMPNGKVGSYAAVSDTGNYWGMATGNQVFLRANAYDANRANLTIYNEAEANTVDVDVSTIYANGTQLQVRNVQDYFNDIQTLMVLDGSITVNMQAANRTVATPVGWTAPAKTFPQFGAFVLQA